MIRWKTITIKNLENIILAVYAFTTFVSSSFYLCWNTYEIRSLSYLVQLVSYLAVIPLTWFAVRSWQGKINRFLLFGIIFSFALEFQSNYLGALYESRLQLRLLANLFVLFLLPEEERKKIFEYMLGIFAVMTLPCLIYYLLQLAGIHLPYGILYGMNESKTAAGVYYEHYFGGLIISGGPRRYCGMFDEPGVVGTYAALLFTGAEKKGNKVRWLVLVEGLLSFSMACYAILLLYILMKVFTKGILPFLGTCAVMVIALNVFMNINFTNPSLSMIQSRINTSSLMLVEDNRTSEEFDEFYEEFKETGGYSLFMGEGRTVFDHRSLNPGSSYKMLLVRYGIMGVLLLIGIYGVILMRYGLTKNNLPFVAAFTASVYQRPHIFTIFYVCLFLCALSYMSEENQDFVKEGRIIPAKLTFRRRKHYGKSYQNQMQ